MNSKKLIITVLTIISFAGIGIAQEKEQPERIKLVPSTHNSSSQTDTEKEIERCENQLKALDAKEKWIKENPEELKTAKETGWFEMAEKQRRELNARIEELKK